MQNSIYTPPFKPRLRQQEALNKSLGADAFALLMKMRTGKTKTVLDDFGRLELNGKVQDLAIIAPAGALPPWLSEIDLHMSTDLRSRTRVHMWKSGGGDAHKKALDLFLDVSVAPRVLLMNVEALSSVKRARETIIKFCSQNKTYVAVDEATIIKNPTAARTKFILDKLSPLADVRRILSGLLTPKSPLDAFAPFFFLDWRIIGQRSYYSFRNRYAEVETEYYGGRSVQVVKGFRNLDELQARIRPYSYQCSLSDCYDAPEKIYIKREVELTPQQARIYQELKTYATALISGTDYVTATVVIAQMIRLHQVLCGFTRDESGEYHDIPENRTSTLIEWLEETDEKAIIWCSYDRQLQKITEALRRHFGGSSVSRFWGGNRATREGEEHVFKTNPLCRFMVATPAAGGRGREWSVANLNIYASNTNNLEHREQSEDRPQAVGKIVPVTYGDLIVPGTVDETFIHALREKIDLATLVTGENWRKWLI